MRLQKFFPLALVLGMMLLGCTRPADKLPPGAEQLGGSWVLQRLNGEVLDSGQFARGLPQLAFDLSQKRVSGHTGCNRLSGTFAIQGDRITFRQLASTKMACAGVSVEQPFLNILNDSTLTFKLLPEELTLLQENKPVLVFKKGA
jgi:heat shock protein HslJ